MHGFLLVDKPDGMTSHDVINRVRRFTGERRVGHAGTLDPFATGLLIVGVGRMATREFPKLVGLDKEYEAIFMFGATSDTDDRTGTISPTLGAESNKILERQALDYVMKTFTGAIEQIPPAYSAIKIKGKKMYEAAREGTPIEAKARAVTVHAFNLLGAPKPTANGQRITVRIRCGSGTYVRSLARDLGGAIGMGGYVEELRRTSVGPFRIDEAVPLNALNSENILDALQTEEAVLSRLTPSATVIQ